MPSSVIEWMRYEPRRRALLIGFRGGRGVYRYFDVPAGEWQEFLEASSKGTYLNREFKRKDHPYEKMSGVSSRWRRGVDQRSELFWPSRSVAAPDSTES